MNVRPRILTGCNLDGSLPKKSFTCLFSVWKCFNRSVYKHLSSLTVLVVFYHVPKLRQKHEASVLQGHAKKKMEELQSRAESAQASLDKAGIWEIEGTILSRSGPRCRLSRKWMTLIVVQLPFPCWNRRAAAWIFIEALLEKSTMALATHPRQASERLAVVEQVIEKMRESEVMLPRGNQSPKIQTSKPQNPQGSQGPKGSSYEAPFLMGIENLPPEAGWTLNFGILSVAMHCNHWPIAFGGSCNRTWQHGQGTTTFFVHWQDVDSWCIDIWRLQHQHCQLWPMHTSMFRGSTEERGLYRTFTVRGWCYWIWGWSEADRSWSFSRGVDETVKVTTRKSEDGRELMGWFAGNSRICQSRPREGNCIFPVSSSSWFLWEYIRCWHQECIRNIARYS